LVDVTVFCLLIGEKPIGILWSRDGKRLDPKSDPGYTIREEILTHGVLSDLSVKRSERTDTALFTCVATNAFGSDETSINLIVQGEFGFIYEKVKVRTWSIINLFCELFDSLRCRTAGGPVWIKSIG